VSSARVAPKAHRRTPSRTVLMRHPAQDPLRGPPLGGCPSTELPRRGFE